MQVIAAPSNLGLRPLRPGHVPGTWRAPSALATAGLLKAVGENQMIELARPEYSPHPQPGTRMLNGQTMRIFNLALAEVVRQAVTADQFALVIGGDCSILLGALAGARVAGPLSLIHIDGHSDFRHPGNYDASVVLGSVAGMDLALATGRGDVLGTNWPGVDGPLIADEQVVQLRERENRDDDFAWPDVNDTAFNRIGVFEARSIGADGIISRINETLSAVPQQRFWTHLDIDVLDQAIMPAVDSPGSPGIEPEDLVIVLRRLISDAWCCGMTVTVFDPDLDPEGTYARLIVSVLAQLPFSSRMAG